MKKAVTIDIDSLSQYQCVQLTLRGEMRPGSILQGGGYRLAKIKDNGGRKSTPTIFKQVYPEFSIQLNSLAIFEREI